MMPHPPLIRAFPFMRRIDRYAGPPLCLALGFLCALARRLRPSRGRTPAGVRNVLVIKFWGMGSIVLTTPALRALRTAYPGARITFLTFEQNESICRMLPWIDDVYAYRATGAAAFLASLLALVRFLRRQRFDVVIDFEFFANFTSIVTGLSGAPVTVGFETPKFWQTRFYTHTVPFDHRHISDIFLKAAEALGAAPDGAQLDPPRVASDAPRTSLAQILAARSVAPSSPLICININASSLDHKRRWPIHAYRQLIERILAALPHFRLVLIGSRDEAPYVAGLMATLPRDPRVVDLCGLLSLEQLVLLLERARLFVGNDSGPLHLAAAVGVATVSFFGPETPALYGPRGDRHTVLYAGIPCSPCLNVHNSKDNSACRENVCLKAITVAEAWAAVREQVGEHTGSWPTTAAGGVR